MFHCLFMRHYAKLSIPYITIYRPAALILSSKKISLQYQYQFTPRNDKCFSLQNCHFSNFPRFINNDLNYDRDLTKRIERMIFDDKRAEAIETLKNYSVKDVYVSPKVILKLLSFSSFTGDLDGFNECRKIYKKAYADSYENNMEFSHYYAQLLWKKQRNTEALKLFTRLILKDNHLKGKIVDLMKFFVKSVLKANDVALTKELLKTAEKFAECNAKHAAVMIWKEMFVSSDSEIQQMADGFLQNHPSPSSFIAQKVDGIIQDAWNENRDDILKRLMEIVRLEKNEKLKSKVCSALIDFQCINNDFAGVCETIRIMTDENMKFSPESFRHVFAFFSYQGVRVPTYLLNYRHQASRTDIKYHF